MQDEEATAREIGCDYVCMRVRACECVHVLGEASLCVHFIVNGSCNRRRRRKMPGLGLKAANAVLSKENDDNV